MTASLLSLAGQTEAAGGEESLPWPPIAYGLVTLGMFLALLALLWAFRNSAPRLEQQLNAQHTRDSHAQRTADERAGDRRTGDGHRADRQGADRQSSAGSH
ncbi:hypothetical protein FB554_1770 [Barrientosiimonas humi]|uniref:Uncharacterized protein n=1 Tax=Barrientosiimonas humi TaxID=999931 RepID=A0A542XCS6_9MICO|nr:hypothetical protein [Barrientosiimonas humi]TQL33619.1 hypothetical protein FB554_1770 [Barrientosiimonas humi]CAG7573606.1 hypothetical protein BH39T_PBIAJDOK_02244 [Barrientosiimonas humi]